MAYKVLVVDDENMHRQLFSMIVKNSSDYDLAGELKSANLADQFCKSNKVDLVLMDVVMKDGSDGLDTAEKIKQINPQIKILIVTSMPEATFMRRAKSIGVDSFWYKEVEDEPLLDVMNKTMEGEHIYPNTVPIVELGLAKNTDLTERELEVLRELTMGYGNQEIADRLGMSLNTTKSHIKSLMSKTGCATRTELAIKAYKSGLIVLNITR